MQWVRKKKKIDTEWERYFAIWPVPVRNGLNYNYGTYPLREGQTMACLCWVERQYIDSREGEPSYIYRLPVLPVDSGKRKQ